MKVIIFKGLPGSGKTTKARLIQKENPGEFMRLNKDDLRAMLENSSEFVPEDLVVRTRDFMLRKALEMGKSVIIDDTNLNPYHEKRIREIVGDMQSISSNKAEIEIIDLTNLSLGQVIEQDKGREKKVGEEVILNMYNKFLKEK
jgi:predicted kinase